MNKIYKLLGLPETPEARKIYLQKYLGNAGARVWVVFRALLLFGLCFVLLYPLIYMVSMAFRPVEETFDPAVIWIPKQFTLQNFKDVWDLMEYPKALKTSLEVNVLSSLLQIITCALAGYGFARFRFKGKGLFFALLVIAIVVPPQMPIIPMYLQYRYFTVFGILDVVKLFVPNIKTVNLLDTNLTFYLPAIFGVGLNGALFVYIFRQFFSGLPKELEDAAAIDGCGFLQTFLRIMVPNAGAVFLTTIILSIVWYWNDYNLGTMFFTHHKTIMTALVELKAGMFKLELNFDPYRQFTRLQAGSLMAILPVMVMYVILQKYFVAGIERSGITG